ncbi:MAG: PQQ-dependent sugar dehydrogenase [Pyrinomonadaceae bacterium]
MRHLKFLVVSLIALLLLSFLAAAQTASSYQFRLQTVLTGLTRPVLIRNAGDGSKRLFIVQQTGIIKVLQPGSNAPTNLIDLSSKIIVPVATGDERGLLGLAFHPQFATNGKFYVNYTRVGDGTTVVAEYKTTTGTGSSNTGDIASERILFTIPQPYSNHNGGMVEFGPDGYLYIGQGDGGSANDPGARAQNKSQLLGKILRVDVNVPQGSSVPYLIPPTNPFTGAGTARCDTGSAANGTSCQEIYTYGMRNPWRWSFDRGGNHALWVADVGQNAIEEVDVITSGGGNYGWRVYEGNSCTGNDPQLCTGGSNPITQIPPIFQYTHSNGRCSITGGYVYRGTQGSLPAGAYIYGDYCTGEIFMWNGSQSTVLQDTPRNIISFGQDEDGELYVCYSNGQIDKITRARANADFDGDAKTDFSVFRFSNSTWYILNSSNNSVRGQQFGQSGDVPAPEDYDGDGKTDIAVWRQSNGTWYYIRSSDNTFAGVQFGQSGDVPVAADYDGDGKADIAVYRSASGVWYRLNSSNGTVSAVQFGSIEDDPIPSDYDGDGKTDIAVFRPSTGVWYRINSSNGAISGVAFGISSDLTVQGDYDGDGKTDVAVFRPNTNIWYILRSSDGAVQSYQFGANADIPVVGDYDGDGRDDIAVFRRSNGTWYYLTSRNGTIGGVQFGQNGDVGTPFYDRP